MTILQDYSDAGRAWKLGSMLFCWYSPILLVRLFSPAFNTLILYNKYSRQVSNNRQCWKEFARSLNTRILSFSVIFQLNTRALVCIVGTLRAHCTTTLKLKPYLGWGSELNEDVVEAWTLDDRVKHGNRNAPNLCTPDFANYHIRVGTTAVDCGWWWLLWECESLAGCATNILRLNECGPCIAALLPERSTRLISANKQICPLDYRESLITAVRRLAGVLLLNCSQTSLLATINIKWFWQWVGPAMLIQSVTEISKLKKKFYIASWDAVNVNGKVW